MKNQMIEKVRCFFSTYNIVVGITITILAIYTVDIIRSFSTDIIIPLISPPDKNIEHSTKKIWGKTLKTGLFLSSLIKYFITMIIVIFVIYRFPEDKLTSLPL